MDEDNDSSSDEASPGFISASQFDPEPVSLRCHTVLTVCRLSRWRGRSVHTNTETDKQANKAQQDKLAALKEWAHIDAFDGSAIRGIKDNLLYHMLRDAYKTDEVKAQKMTADDEPPTKKLRTGESSSSSRATSTETPDSDDSDEEPVRVAGRLRRKTRRPTRLVETGLDSVKKHNLHTIAEEGGVGRVLFVLEKESKSRL